MVNKPQTPEEIVAEKTVIKESACFRILERSYLHHTEWWVQRRIAFLFFFTLYWENATRRPFEDLAEADNHFELCVRVLEVGAGKSEDLLALTENR